MLCETCYGMLRGQDGRLWKGTYDLSFNHHTQVKDLHRAATRCGICRVLFEALKTELESVQPPEPYWVFTQILRLLGVLQLVKWLQNLNMPRPPGAMLEQTAVGGTSVLEHIDDLTVSITASLRLGQQDVASNNQPDEEIYQLAFKIRFGQVRCRTNFALKKIGTKAAYNIPSSVFTHQSSSRRSRSSVPNASGTHNFIR
jgi:hypothetical protein